MDLIKEFVEVEDKLRAKTTNAFRPDSTFDVGDVRAALDKAAEDDEYDTITFGLETEDGDIVKVYVEVNDADMFEVALSELLGKEDDIEEVLNLLSTEFDIVDVDWPEDNSDDQTITGDDEEAPVPDDEEVLDNIDSEDEAPAEEPEASDDSEMSDETADEIPAEEPEQTDTESSSEEEEEDDTLDPGLEITGEEREDEEEDEEDEVSKKESRSYGQLFKAKLLQELDDLEGELEEDDDNVDELSMDANPETEELFKRYGKTIFMKFALHVILELGLTPELITLVFRRDPKIRLDITQKMKDMGTAKRQRVSKAFNFPEYAFEGYEEDYMELEEAGPETEDLYKRYGKTRFLRFALDVLLAVGLSADHIALMFKREPSIRQIINQRVKDLGEAKRQRISKAFAPEDSGDMLAAGMDDMEIDENMGDAALDGEYDDAEPAFDEPAGEVRSMSPTIEHGTHGLTITGRDFAIELDYDEMIDLTVAMGDRQPIRFENEDGIVSFIPKGKGYKIKHGDRSIMLSNEDVYELLSI